MTHPDDLTDSKPNSSSSLNSDIGNPPISRSAVSGIPQQLPISDEVCLKILRRFEPVTLFTQGERFFPMDIDRYLHECSLWVQRPDDHPQIIVPQGKLTIDALVEERPLDDTEVHFLKFIEPMDLLELTRFQLFEAVRKLSGQSEAVFRAGLSRLARVGLSSRFVDALFSLSLLLRGRVPGDTAAAAILTYDRIQKACQRFVYYGRVVQQNGWIVLQYWFFYPFNNWRSGFFGVNDHEADWEMISIYCSVAPQEGGILNENDLTPEWVAYASHDYSGDDLRRRWDDPELVKLNGHPVVYAGAGSHASYFTPGEYLAELELPYLKPLTWAAEKIRSFWTSFLRQGGGSSKLPEMAFLKVPFVDYARGDGVGIGPGQARSWEAILIDENTPWVSKYSGLWGLFARDPIAGENAPSGPMFNRDRTIRRCWYDPVGWAGLDKVPPRPMALDALKRQQVIRSNEILKLEKKIRENSAELASLGIELTALESIPGTKEARIKLQRQVETLAQETRKLRQEWAEGAIRLQALQRMERRLKQGELGPLRAHLRRVSRPYPTGDLQLGWFAEGLAAISIGLVMVGLVLLILFARQYVIFGLAALVGLIVLVEAGFRRRLNQLVNAVVIGLAVVSLLILLYEFFWIIVIASLMGAGIFLIWENIREIQGV